MSKRILTVLAPVLAIMAFAVLPAMAQADEIQASGTNETFSATSGNLTTSIAGGANIECTTSTLVFQRQSATQALVVGGSFQGHTGEEQYCQTSIPDIYADIQTNAGTVGWQLHLEGGGMATLQGLAGRIDFTAHYYRKNQSTGVYTPIGQCQFKAPTAGVQISYGYGANPGIETSGTEFEAEETEVIGESGLCANGTLAGSFTTSNLTIDE